MRRISTLLFVAAFALLTFGETFAAPLQDQTTNTQADQPRPLKSPRTGRRRRRRSERRDVCSGATSAYAYGGKSMGRGAKGLARNVKHGRIVRGGKEFGKGAGGFGKGVGYGSARVAKKGAKGTVTGVKKGAGAVKNAVTP